MELEAYIETEARAKRADLDYEIQALKCAIGFAHEPVMAARVVVLEMMRAGIPARFSWPAPDITASPTPPALPQEDIQSNAD